MRRSILLGVMAIALAFPAAVFADTEPPGSDGPGAQTYHFRNLGAGGFAAFTNLAGTEEDPAAGTYFFTFVDFSSQVSTDGGQTYASSYVCVFSESISIDASGNWEWLSGVGGCAEGATITTDRRLGQATVRGSIPVIDCLSSDVETGECLEIVELGSIDVDLTLMGTGRTYRYHGTGSGGTAGQYQYAYHGTGSNRSAVPSGTIVFDGQSLTEGATQVDGLLFNSRDGWFEVSI